MADNSVSYAQLSDQPHFVRVVYSAPADSQRNLEGGVCTLLRSAEHNFPVSSVRLIRSTYSWRGELKHFLLVTLESASSVVNLKRSVKAKKCRGLILAFDQSFPQPGEFQPRSIVAESANLSQSDDSSDEESDYSIQDAIVAINEELSQHDNDQAYGRAFYLSHLSPESRRQYCLHYLNILIKHLRDNGLFLEAIDRAVLSLEWIGYLDKRFGTAFDNRHWIRLPTPFHPRTLTIRAKTLKRAKECWEDNFTTFLSHHGVAGHLMFDTVVKALELMREILQNALGLGSFVSNALPHSLIQNALRHGTDLARLDDRNRTRRAQRVNNSITRCGVPVRQ